MPPPRLTRLPDFRLEKSGREIGKCLLIETHSSTCPFSVPPTSCPRVPRVVPWFMPFALDHRSNIPRNVPPPHPRFHAQPSQVRVVSYPSQKIRLFRLPESVIPKSCHFNRLPPLQLSCLNFRPSLPLFSITCRLFCKNRGGGVSPRSRWFLSVPRQPIRSCRLCAWASRRAGAWGLRGAGGRARLDG